MVSSLASFPTARRFAWTFLKQQTCHHPALKRTRSSTSFCRYLSASSSSSSEADESSSQKDANFEEAREYAPIVENKHESTPLSSLIEIPNDYHLVPTKEDYIPLEKGQRLVCVGDVHGDIQALQNFLEIAQVVDDQARWCGGDTVLVQCGDVLDRGSQELACFRLLGRLSQEASLQGGKVIVLWGNHEVLNAISNFDYATDDEEYEQAFGPVLDEALQCRDWRAQYFLSNRNHFQPVRQATFEPGGLLAKPLMQHLKVAVQVGKTVCVHAGLTKQQLETYGDITVMNQQAKEWVQQIYVESFQNVIRKKDEDTLDPVWVRQAVDRIQTNVRAVPPFFLGAVGAVTPIWMRHYSHPSDVDKKTGSQAHNMMDDVLSALPHGAARLVMGHTVQYQGINAALSERAWRIDVGASRGVARGTPEVLEIIQEGEEEDQVSILTRNGRIPASKRHALDPKYQVSMPW